MLIFCVRHGESAFNSAGRVQGQLDVPLSELGHRQSAAVAAAFRGQPIDAVYASPLARAFETARPIADAVDRPVQTDDRLKELNAGVFQGLLHDEMATRYPDDFRRWKSGDPDYQVPQGESRRQLMQRGEAAFLAIRESGQQRVVVVAHGGLLNAAFKALLGIPAERNPFMLYNASISLIDWSGPLKLVTLNQIDHLRTPDGPIESRTGDL